MNRDTFQLSRDCHEMAVSQCDMGIYIRSIYTLSLSPLSAPIFILNVVTLLKNSCLFIGRSAGKYPAGVMAPAGGGAAAGAVLFAREVLL